MGLDLEIHRGLLLVGDLTTHQAESLGIWVAKHKGLGWIITIDNEYDNEYHIDITPKKYLRGDVETYMKELIAFLKRCKKYNLTYEGTMTYRVSWGDYEDGVIFVSSKKNKAYYVSIDVFSGKIKKVKLPWHTKPKSKKQSR